MVVRASQDTWPSTIFHHLTPSIVRLIAILYLGGLARNERCVHSCPTTGLFAPRVQRIAFRYNIETYVARCSEVRFARATIKFEKLVLEETRRMCPRFNE